MKACLSRQAVLTTSKFIAELVDHRCFHDEFENRMFVGKYICSLVRNAVATELRAKRWKFADIDFLKSLHAHINNPCVAGFMMKQAVLSSIEFHGLAIGENGLDNIIPMVMFEGKFPNFHTNIAGPMLYCPGSSISEVSMA